MRRTKKNEDIVYNVIEWCVAQYGESKYQDTDLNIDFDIDSETTDKADFDFEINEITLYLKNIDSVFELIINVIHEFIHYLQPKNWYYRYFNQITSGKKKITYEEYFLNPYEITAKCLSEIEAIYCMNDLNYQKYLAK